jgi:hypothetical protein
LNDFCQIANVDLIAAPEDDSALNQVAQLAKISRPLIGSHCIQCGRSEPSKSLARSVPEEFQLAPGDPLQILVSIA